MHKTQTFKSCRGASWVVWGFSMKQYLLLWLLMYQIKGNYTLSEWNLSSLCRRPDTVIKLLAEPNSCFAVWCQCQEYNNFAAMWTIFFVIPQSTAKRQWLFGLHPDQALISSLLLLVHLHGVSLCWTLILLHNNSRLFINCFSERHCNFWEFCIRLPLSPQLTIWNIPYTILFSVLPFMLLQNTI